MELSLGVRVPSFAYSAREHFFFFYFFLKMCVCVLVMTRSLLRALCCIFMGMFLLGNVAYAVPHYVSEEETFYVHKLNFSGEFPDMETMKIHAQRKKHVKFDVTGNFPKLETISYLGSFGYLHADFKGEYPSLTSIHISCTTCQMDMDFRGKWFQNSTIFICNEKQPISLVLPRDVGVIVHTTTTLQGKVLVEGDLIRSGRGVWHKTYHNSSVGTSPITLVFHVKSSGGTISLR